MGMTVSQVGLTDCLVACISSHHESTTQRLKLPNHSSTTSFRFMDYLIALSRTVIRKSRPSSGQPHVNLISLCGIKLQLSSSHHPQTDEASEVMNRMVENYLRCYCSLRQDDWHVLLPAADFAYNSAESQDLGVSPLEVDLWWIPNSQIYVLHKDSASVESMDELKTRLRAALEDAQCAHESATESNVA